MGLNLLLFFADTKNVKNKKGRNSLSTFKYESGLQCTIVMVNGKFLCIFLPPNKSFFHTHKNCCTSHGLIFQC